MALSGRAAAAALVAAILLASVARGAERAGAPAGPEKVASQKAAAAAQAAIRLRRASGASDNFGVACCQILQIPAASFTPISNAPRTTSGGLTDPYVYLSGFGQSEFDLWAAVTLPSGAHLRFIGLSYFDGVVGDLAVILRRYYGGNPAGSGDPGEEDVGSVVSTGQAGYGYAVDVLDHTIANDAAGDPAAGQYVLEVRYPAVSAAAAFKSVEIWWEYQVSPAPATASFGDVPVSDFGFQFIEALAASGITGGCGGGNYCPDSPVTRRQMAIFLAKALGLSWAH